MFRERIKALLPNHPVPIRIRRGPFRGARIVMNPRASFRKIFGLYEHEVNGWLEEVLPRVCRVVDVGANDGYFTFGCASAFQRLGKSGEIIAIENQDQHIAQLQQSIAEQNAPGITYKIVQALAGRDNKPGFVTLDSLGEPVGQENALVKIDVEGAEIDVILGGQNWIQPSNFFIIEVHDEDFLTELGKLFARHGHKLTQIHQHPLWLIGRERREEKNCWLVSDLGA